MKFGPDLKEEVEGVPLAPLIDIVFLTLVFFMTTSVFATLESEIDITLPTADAAERGERTRGEIFINVRDTGDIILNAREVSIEELQETLFRVAEVFPGGSVIIRGDQGANYGQIVSVLNACRKADIQNVSFAALEEEPE